MWRPELSPKETKKIVRESEKIFLKEVEKSLSDLTDDELKNKSFENYRKIIEENKIKGPFVMFLQAFNRYFKESEAQKEKRIIANYIRHNLTSYDKVISEVTDEYWVPNFFFNDLWESSAKAISTYYPHLSGVLSEGMRAKSYYESFKDGNLESKFKNEEEFFKFISIYEEIEEEQNELIAKEEEEYRLKVEKEFSEDVFLENCETASMTLKLLTWEIGQI